MFNSKKSVIHSGPEWQAEPPPMHSYILASVTVFILADPSLAKEHHQELSKMPARATDEG